MVHLVIKLEGDGVWTDLVKDDERIIHIGNGAPPLQITVLEGGMTSGKPSVSLRVDLPDGRIVIAETSLALLLAAADAFKARYGDPREDSWRQERHYFPQDNDKKN